MTKISLLYAKTGGGHKSLAQATIQALDQYCPGAFSYSIFDPFPEITASAYKRLSVQLQKLWKFSYDATNSPQISSFVHNLNSITTSEKLTNYFKKYRPQIVITNNGLVTTEMQLALQKSGVKAKTVVLFADPFTPHELWFSYKNADLYLCPTDQVAQIAVSRSLPPNRIKTIGWLTKGEFLPGPMDKKLARETLGLEPNKFICFVGGAGQGGGKIYDICTALLDHPRLLKTTQVIVNPGANPGLTHKLMQLAQFLPQFFYIIPIAHNMRTLLSASDLVVGKAGPNFLFESIHTLRPFLATGCLPGQEEGNLDFIRDSHIGWVEENPQKAAAIIEKLSQNPSSLSQLIGNIQLVKSQHINAAQNLAAEIVKINQ